MNEKVAVVTGASSGIGRATALLFSTNGWNVVAFGRNGSELQALRDQARDADGSIRIHLGDITETTHVERLVSDTVDSFGRVDSLVNAAGIIKSGSIEDTTLDDWDKMMNINVRSAFYLTQKCVPHLAVTKGNVVNVS